MAMDHIVLNIILLILTTTVYGGLPDQNYRQSLHHAQEYAARKESEASQQKYEDQPTELQQEYRVNEEVQGSHTAEETLKTDDFHSNQGIQFVMVPREKYAEALQEYLQHHHLQIQVQEQKIEEPQRQLFRPNLPIFDNTREPDQEQHDPQPKEHSQVPLQQQELQLMPYEYGFPHKQLQINSFHKQEPWRPIPHPEGLKDLMTILPHIEKDLHDVPHPQHQLQYAPEFKTVNLSELEKILEQIKLANIKAHATAEAIANSPPIVVHKDVTITKRRPINIIKAVTLPVPAPVLVPVPKPYEVKVPQPYAVPLEIIRPVPIPVIKTEKTQVEKPVPVEIEKHVHVPVEKKVFYRVNRPVPVEKKVPFEIKKEVPVPVQVYKPQKFTIVRHIWDH
ncbi:hypothetical protein EVAR_69732_1 [Eumeta japonica]|uniref:Zinc finger protein 512B n=1 Tax=Eumeta variegata TaxID=151549 RepID=A0A4C2A940_EUMVA|nr:hypothetical protein EVAR_69732_1 [Eumeta japonica]